MIGKILCKLGIHKWEVVEKIHIGEFMTFFEYDYTICERCDKLKK